LKRGGYGFIFLCAMLSCVALLSGYAYAVAFGSRFWQRRVFWVPIPSLFASFSGAFFCFSPFAIAPQGTPF
jgi:hypothetical protein